MKILESTDKFRIIESEFHSIDDNGDYITIAPIYKVQMKFWWFWITVKTFDNINEIELSFNEAFDCYHNLVNPYKYHG